MPETVTPAPEAVLCSKCGKNPRADEDGTNPWCNPCKAQYQKEYKEMLLNKQFKAGVSAMRSCLANEFENIIGTGSFTTREIAHMIRNAPGPIGYLKS